MFCLLERRPFTKTMSGKNGFRKNIYIYISMWNTCRHAYICAFVSLSRARARAFSKRRAREVSSPSRIAHYFLSRSTHNTTPTSSRFFLFSLPSFLERTESYNRTEKRCSTIITTVPQRLQLYVPSLHTYIFIANARHSCRASSSSTTTTTTGRRGGVSFDASLVPGASSPSRRVLLNHHHRSRRLQRRRRMSFPMFPRQLPNAHSPSSLAASRFSTTNLPRKRKGP